MRKENFNTRKFISYLRFYLEQDEKFLKNIEQPMFCKIDLRKKKSAISRSKRRIRLIQELIELLPKY